MKERLDIKIQKLSLVHSRTKANELIKEGRVSVDGIIVTKPSTMIGDDAVINIDSKNQFVSRAGEKLDNALAHWRMDVSHRIVADVGASTGGFSECLLRRGAEKIYAIDVGTNQLDNSLRNNPRIFSIEKTDIRKISLPEEVDMVVVDLSFISLTIVMKEISKMVKSGGDIILLVKPQFELGKEIMKKSKGVVRDPDLHKKAIDRVKISAESHHLSFIDLIPSSIKGEHGNQEFFVWCKKSD